MSTVMVVERGSDAWKELQQAFDDPAARMVAVDVRPDGVAVKTDEYGWTPTLRTNR